MSSSQGMQGGMQGGMQKPPGPPYAPQTALIGGQPTVGIDVPIVAVFLALFVGGAVMHMTFMQLNNKQGHKFLMSGMLFGFCMARITTMVMRIVWATKPDNIGVAIASQVFNAAGVVLLFIANLILAQRIVRSLHPNIGWTSAFSLLFKGFYFLTVAGLIMVVTVTVLNFYTLNMNTHRIARDVQLTVAGIFTAMSFAPIPLVLAAMMVPQWPHKVERFGYGTLKTKIAIVLFTSTLLCLGASFRFGTSLLDPRPKTDPAWYQSRAAFYCFYFVIEIICIYTYGLGRVDLRFWIPNGSSAAGHYSASVSPVLHKRGVRPQNPKNTEDTMVESEDPEDPQEEKEMDN